VARPRKPHKLRVLEGGRGKSRPLSPDLKAPADPLAAPRGLSREELAAWKLHSKWLRRLGIESGVDGGSFLAMVRHYCRAIRADGILRKKGLTMVSATNGEIRRPEVSISAESWRAYSLLAQQFGLTPAARAKLGTKPERPERAGDVPEELANADSGGA
jgi:P27 family predicted phage terminase small subunit